MSNKEENFHKYVSSKIKWESYSGNSNETIKTDALAFLKRLPPLTGTGPSVRALLEYKTSSIIAIQGDITKVLGIEFKAPYCIDTMVEFFYPPHVNLMSKNFPIYLNLLLNSTPKERDQLELYATYKFWKDTKYIWVNQRVCKSFNDNNNKVTHVLIEFTDVSLVKQDEVAEYIVYNKYHKNYIVNDTMKDPNKSKELLTPTELKVVSLIKEGITDHEIAEKQFISIHTLKQHRKNIYKKLNIKKSTQLLKWAYELK